MSASTRVLMLWCPDWPVVAALGEAELSATRPAAVIAAHRVVACTAPARALGVRRGMRRRDAQSRCPELLVLDDHPDRDARAFEPVLAALEELRPGVAVLRPGLAALRAPGRYYGGEEAAAAVVAERLVELGVWDCRIGIADELFTAEQAARSAGVQESRVVEAGRSRDFLVGLPVEVLDDADAVSLLRRLGIETLGQLGALPAPDVRARFGLATARVHQVLGGVEADRFAPRTPPPELACQVDFEPVLESWETVCFSARRTAEELVRSLAERRLVCTTVRIEIGLEPYQPDDPDQLVRTWLHPRWFTAVDLVDRIRYQLVARPPGAPVASVRLEPETVVPEHVHAEGLWGGTDARVERGIARLQGLLGHEAVRTPVLQGGRSPGDRQSLVPWGERAVGLRPRDLPWPGQLPGPAPARVFTVPWPVEVCGPEGQVVGVDERGVLTAEPSRLRLDGSWQPVAAWAGPWPVEESWWDAGAGAGGAGRAARFQLVGVDGRAWLVTCADGAWQAVAGYD